MASLARMGHSEQESNAKQGSKEEYEKEVEGTTLDGVRPDALSVWGASTSAVRLRLPRGEPTMPLLLFGLLQILLLVGNLVDRWR